MMLVDQHDILDVPLTPYDWQFAQGYAEVSRKNEKTKYENIIKVLEAGLDG